MQNYQMYLNQAKEIGLTVYRNEYFQQLIVICTIVLFFLLGRMSYDKKLTHLLEMVNDAETTRKSLTVKLENENKSVKKFQSKKIIIWVLLGLVILVNAGLYYLYGKINVMYLAYTIIPFILIALTFFLLVNLAKWNKDKTERRLKNTSITAQAEIKQILKIFGDGLKNRLKVVYESEIDSQWAKQSKQECKLYKCYNEKKCYEDLNKLYEQVIDEIKKFNMCDVCLSEENISVQKLGLNELETQIKNFKRARTGKLNVGQKKEIVNRLLSEYQKMNEKMPHICKKGCCIKQRSLIESAKVKYHDRLKRTQLQLASTEKKI